MNINKFKIIEIIKIDNNTMHCLVGFLSVSKKIVYA